MDSFSLLRIANSPAWAQIFNNPEPEPQKQAKIAKEKYLMHGAFFEHNTENNSATLCVLLTTNKKYYKLSAGLLNFDEINRRNATNSMGG